MSTVDEIVRAAMSLPVADQWRVWDHLAANLEPTPDEDEQNSDAWRTEINRRSDEIDAGTARLIPGDDVTARARALLGMPPHG